MLRQKRARVLILLLVAMVAAVSWRGWVDYRQSTLDRALIDAVSTRDADAAVSLLADGASANAKDWRERESHGWQERFRHLLTGRFYEANPAPVLAIAKETQDEAVIRTLEQYGADADEVRHWQLVGDLPGEDEAITNGVLLLHLIEHSALSDGSEQAKSWIGKRVAFEGAEIRGNVVPVKGVTVKIEFASPKPVSRDVLTAAPVGFIKSIDVKHKIVFIRVKGEDYHILWTLLDAQS